MVRVVDIIFGEATAQEAVEQCEKTAEDELRHFLSELEDGDGIGELSDMIARLAEGLDLTDEVAPTDTEGEPIHIKTDLFGTKGAEAR